MDQKRVQYKEQFKVYDHCKASDFVKEYSINQKGTVLAFIMELETQSHPNFMLCNTDLSITQTE